MVRIRYGEIWMAHLGSRPGCVLCGDHPVIIFSNQKANRYSPVATVIPLTSAKKKSLPCHVSVNGHGLSRKSTALVEQITTIDRQQLYVRLGTLENTRELQLIEDALRNQTAA